VPRKKLHALVAVVEDTGAISQSKPTRNFPAPWRGERIPGGFVVKDANSQQLAHVHADNRQTVNSLTEDEARRIASNIARLPDFLGKEREP
jgi:hypothetical protein